MEYCIKCNTELRGKYCSNCGFPKELKRIDRQYIIDEISSVLNLNKGVFYTIKELLLRPGKTVNQFIREDRNRLVKPIVFIVICSLVYSIFQQIFNFEDGYINYSSDKVTFTTSIFNWIARNYGYSNILMGVFIASWIKILYRKEDYNFYEILILLCFAMGTGMLLFALFGIADSLIELKIMDKGYLIGILYILWAIGQFFGAKKLINYPKALLSYFLGMLTFIAGILLTGYLIENIL